MSGLRVKFCAGRITGRRGPVRLRLRAHRRKGDPAHGSERHRSTFDLADMEALRGHRCRRRGCHQVVQQPVLDRRPQGRVMRSLRSARSWSRQGNTRRSRTPDSAAGPCGQHLDPRVQVIDMNVVEGRVALPKSGLLRSVPVKALERSRQDVSPHARGCVLLQELQNVLRVELHRLLLSRGEADERRAMRSASSCFEVPRRRLRRLWFGLGLAGCR